jgi:Flp pilus assembly protein TadG
MNVTLFVLLVPFIFGLAGLALDGGQMLVTQRQIQGVAEGAARAGAEQLDRDAARDNPTAPGALDPDLAWTAAADYVAAQPPGLSAIINANPGQVSVEVTSGAVPVLFVRAIGFTGPIHVRATAIAAPRTGIVSATP